MDAEPCCDDPVPTEHLRDGSWYCWNCDEELDEPEPDDMTVTINGKRYRVEEIRADDGGLQQVAKRGYSGEWKMAMSSEAWMDGQAAYILVPIKEDK